MRRGGSVHLVLCSVQSEALIPRTTCPCSFFSILRSIAWKISYVRLSWVAQVSGFEHIPHIVPEWPHQSPAGSHRIHPGWPLPLLTWLSTQKPLVMVLGIWELPLLERTACGESCGRWQIGLNPGWSIPQYRHGSVSPGPRIRCVHAFFRF